VSDDLIPEGHDAAPAASARPSDLGSPSMPRRRRRGGRVITLLIVLALVLLLPMAAAFVWYWMQVHPGGKAGAARAVEVKEGWGVSDIGDALARNNIIGSSLAFRVYVALDGKRTFSAGKYEFHQHMGLADAVKVLRTGPTVTYGKLALPPGLTIDEIATRVGQQPGLSKDKFLAAAKSGQVRSVYEPANINNLEGLTWPDTYFITEKEDETAILRRLVGAFDKNANELGLAGATQNGVTPYQTIIVASLIQTEAKLEDDRPLIASVVYNRLRDKMPLQIDATLLYARGNKSGPIYNSDKQIDSPYNTYKVSGLPPTPISTVTRASLLAAMNPATTAFKYYVLADKNGKHAFATTLAEHDKNVAEARKKGLLG
jgi:UPF0755 protein